VCTIGDSFNSRHNSLNFLRLVLAAVVLVSHAIALGGFGIQNGINQSSFGQIAVYGFFGISGYLIAGSAMRNHAGRYLWQRFLRIFPAFWACLVVTALLIGVIGWVSRPPVHCGLSCYFTAKDGPYSYIYRDFLLRMNQNSIAGTPTGGGAPLAWNGSVWTLFYEFICYVILMVLAVVGLLRYRAVTLWLTITLWTAIVVITLTPSLDSQFNLFENDTTMNLLKFAAVFMVGAVVFLYRDRIPDTGWLAGACAGLFLASLFLPTGGRISDIAFTPSDLLAPLVAYPLLWLGIHFPFQRIGSRNDYSYGVYIYGFPVSQLMLIWGVQRWGFVPYATMATLVTALLAVASWWAIEKHALKLKSLGVPKAVAEESIVVPSPLSAPAEESQLERSHVRSSNEASRG
jgi:peptidoglycan/LPS O-acetylase OafA/YrhL